MMVTSLIEGTSHFHCFTLLFFLMPLKPEYLAFGASKRALIVVELFHLLRRNSPESAGDINRIAAMEVTKLFPLLMTALATFLLLQQALGTFLVRSIEDNKVCQEPDKDGEADKKT
ncbi:hypothetical protein [Ktedonobacter robiniae]|uniref:hypothetical protein n=1 Tax=Ktedonobacter robiniae TaxID=2778365 RepID=UPI001916A274|nr:hypothetical protein [Ktedonobacter robiniae]